MELAFVVTMADASPREIRHHEYMYCLSRIFSYGLPVYGVVSETTHYTPAEFFPFEKCVYVESTADHNAISKSRKEFVSLRKLVSEVSLDETTWVVKVSGRYMLVNDSFLQRVRMSPKQAVVRKCDDTQMYTFLYAIRFGLLKAILEAELDNTTNIEWHIVHHLRRLVSDAEIEYVSDLGVFANINNEGKFASF